MSALDILALGIVHFAGHPAMSYSPERRAQLLAMWRVNVHN
jgi:hypothetical protein